MPNLLETDKTLCGLEYCSLYDFGIRSSKKESVELQTLKDTAEWVFDSKDTLAAVHGYLDMVNRFSAAGLPLKPDKTLAARLDEEVPAVC